ncbi:MAG: hypothetical protein HC794_06495 [Nitrospiraceae bacterium]|nr:hypothetical protein [Nitrospiraceae bacterium]
MAVTVSGLVHQSQATAHLFPQSDKPLELSKAMDRINQRFGGQAIHPASMHLVAGYGMDDKIAFGRIPDETLPI